jgi:hypothetical protein
MNYFGVVFFVYIMQLEVRICCFHQCLPSLCIQLQMHNRKKSAREETMEKGLMMRGRAGREDCKLRETEGQRQHAC